MAATALLLLTAVVLVGTVLVPVSTYCAWRRKPSLGLRFTTPCSCQRDCCCWPRRWPCPCCGGAPPVAHERRSCGSSFAVGAVAALVGFAQGVRRPEAFIVIVLAAAAPVALDCGPLA